MRYDPKKAPSGSMDFLFLHLFAYMKEEHIQWFNLGMAPLSNVGTSRKSFYRKELLTWFTSLALIFILSMD